jgi:hypothetical protein
MRAVVAGIGIGAAGLLAGQYLLRESRRRELQVYELKGQYYQLLGHAWDHETKDFKVIYRPLYHCEASEGRFEAHVLASSHFSRWESKFKLVSWDQVPSSARAFVLQGPFTHDPDWKFTTETKPQPKLVDVHNRSAIASATRSHEPPLLEHIGEQQSVSRSSVVCHSVCILS